MSTPDQPAAGSHSDETPPKKFSDRIPRRLFGGRVRTTTAALVILFVGLLMLYGQRADHYKTVDEQNAAASATRTAAPRTTEETPDYTEPTRTSTPTSSSTSVPSTSTTSTSDGTNDPEGAQTPTTTTPPGIQLPTIPGIVLPGQTPTTTPAR
ncbi:hypothetical protein [Williamsia phyllosphaerae]|uniref:Uncharacterized protein n=1 Tax=Williamsia phyllosphaerae TaxID=885042 RepID=A0ABQ1USM5_9NOCA|nr:hypothetical protein [Williamsia phyllosphaerae]GGF26197.1 hypothetical protein GCM10007298_22610 [Williamsia phyllosphaerae]